MARLNIKKIVVFLLAFTIIGSLTLLATHAQTINNLLRSSNANSDSEVCTKQIPADSQSKDGEIAKPEVCAKLSGLIISLTWNIDADSSAYKIYEVSSADSYKNATYKAGGNGTASLSDLGPGTHYLFVKATYGSSSLGDVESDILAINIGSLGSSN